MRDVIVIGAGGGGSVAAKELAARGLDVLIVEAGPWWRHPATQWSELENDANNPVSGYLRFGPADREASPWLRELPQPSFLWQVAGVGGTTQHYYGNCPRAMPGVFAGYAGRDRGAYDRAHEFPFTYRDLIPYYRWVERTLPVQTAAMDTKDLVFLAGAQRIGLPVQTHKDIVRASCRPQENAILQPHGTAGRTSDPAKLTYPQARGCTFCGSCIQGCAEPRGAPRNLAAKRSTDNSYIPMALTANAWQRGGRAAALIADAYVTRIETTTVGAGSRVEATGVTWRENATGTTHTEEAQVVILAGGCIENPRLWSASGLPDPNGWVGRGMTDHAFDFVIGEFPFDTGNSRGPASAARADLPGRGSFQTAGLPPGIQAYAATYSDNGMSGLYNFGRSDKAGADTVGRLAGPRLRALMEHGLDRLLSVFVTTDDDVQPTNRVTRSLTLPPDEHGPVARVELDGRARTARTRRNREYLVRMAVRVLRAAGATRVHRMDFPPLILHVQSTMRMGADRANSVLDETAEARWVKRLYVADNSALANSIGGPNPTLTTQALATRTAEHIFVKYFGGEPWVRNEAPVVSTDRRISKALASIDA
jgi:choline dehydrogenase-like flavoprotein